MKNALQIPVQVIECLEYFDAADRGEAYSAIFRYLQSGEEPPAGLSPAARGAFEFARRVIDPILERRRRAAERAAARKAARDAAAKEAARACEKAAATAPVATASAAAESDGDKAISRYVASLRPKVPQQHISTMGFVVASVNSNRDVPRERRDAKIRRELHRLYPGLYKDITYDEQGIVTLIPAA